MFNVRSVVLDNSLKTLFPFINAVVDESLRVRSCQSTERVSAGQLFQIIGVAGKLSSTTALINENNQRLKAVNVIKNSSYKHIFK